jgi:hypothetical protein
VKIGVREEVRGCLEWAENWRWKDGFWVKKLEGNGAVELVLGLYGSRRAGLLLVPAAEGKKMRGKKKSRGAGRLCS